MQAATARNFYALKHAKNELHLGAYLSPSSPPYMVVFRQRGLAEESRDRLEGLANGKKLTHSNARIFPKQSALPKNNNNASPNRSIASASAVRFVVGRPPPPKLYWIGEPKEAIQADRSLALDSVSEEELLYLTTERNVGVAIIDGLAWSDARGVTFSASVVEPLRQGDVQSSWTPVILESLLNL